MTSVESPAKLNLALHVAPPHADGYHPLTSLVQTITWWDLLEIETNEGEDELEVVGLDVPVEGNLVLGALEELRRLGEFPRLTIKLEKNIPVEAGLGGGSSDAAAVIHHVATQRWLEQASAESIAHLVGTDVPLFLAGGTMLISGVGEVIDPQVALSDFAIAVALPKFGLSTPDVYRRWDELEGPTGEAIDDAALPPVLRDRIPIRNDLLPAALDIASELGDFMADLRAAWDTAVCLTGSGSACFGYFASVDEAEDAVLAVASLISTGRGVGLRDHGVRVVR